MNLNDEDLNNEERHSLLDQVEWLLPRVIAAGCGILIFIYWTSLNR